MSESLFALWDPAIAYPSLETMPDLDIVTHIAVERAQPGGYHYLHESTLVWHEDRLCLGWANHREREVNSRDELIRGSWSVDGGFTWQPPTIWAAPPLNGSASYNHPVIASALGKLWGFFTRWDDERPSTEIFVGDPADGTWESTGTRLPMFVPFRPPMRLADGNWILSGECHWYEGAIAISQGDDFTAWEVVTMPRPEGFELLYPEATLLQRGSELVAIMRPRHTPTAPVSVSRDQGHTWSKIEPSNLPMGTSQPYCGQLSTGQQYLVSNHQTAGRTLLSIAVTAPRRRHFPPRLEDPPPGEPPLPTLRRLRRRNPDRPPDPVVVPGRRRTRRQALHQLHAGEGRLRTVDHPAARACRLRTRRPAVRAESLAGLLTSGYAMSGTSTSRSLHLRLSCNGAQQAENAPCRPG